MATKQDPAAKEPKPTADELAEEIAALRAENEALKAKPVADTSRMRNGGAIALALIASLLVALSVPAVWLNRTVMNTDTWVATVAPLAKDAAIQDAVATMASDAIVKQLDAQGRVESALPDNLKLLAAPIGNAVNDFVRKESFTLVRSDKFGDIWTELNRRGHKMLLAGIAGKSDGAVTLEAGTFSLDVGTLIESVKAALAAKGLSFVNNIPTSSLNRTVTLYQSPMLANLTRWVALLNQVAFVLPLFFLLFAAGAFALATDRRLAALWLGAGIVIAGLLPIQGIYLGQSYVLSQLASLKTVPIPAAQAAFNIIFAGLISAEKTLTVFGVVIWAAAVIAGPAAWAVAMRSAFSEDLPVLRLIWSSGRLECG